MSLPSPDKGKEVEKQLLTAEYNAWLVLLEAKTDLNDDIASLAERVYAFAIDRREDEESQFTAEEVRVDLLGKDTSLEEFIGNPNISKTWTNERWIYIQVQPEDPYRSRIGYYEDKGHRWYYTERIDIFLSSKGRAYEGTEWFDIGDPGTHRVQNSAYSYLKQFPPEEGLVKFEEESVELKTRPLERLRGRTLDRLSILRASVQSGTVIEGRHS